MSGISNAISSGDCKLLWWELTISAAVQSTVPSAVAEQIPNS